MTSAKRLLRTNLSQSSSTFFVCMIAFFAGYILRGSTNVPLSTKQETAIKFPPGYVRHLSDIPKRATSHIDKQGDPITKQQLIEPFVFQNVAGFSVATLLPGQVIDSHKHESMVELFFIVSGTGTIQINDETPQDIGPGHFIQVSPPERHELRVKSTATDPMVMIVCGITSDGPRSGRQAQRKLVQYLLW